jgi:Dyp-type peroxidase family
MVMMSDQRAVLTADARSDIQGLITSGYGHLPLAAYLLLRINDPAAACRWIGSLIESIATSAPWPKDASGETIKPTSTVNVAFTAEGLSACDLPTAVLCTFPAEFQEGIASPSRSRILGDTEESAPAAWEIGGPNTEPIHALLVIHALDDRTLDDACATELRRVDQTNGGVVVHAGAAQRGYRPSSDAEPFGFHDGIAQPSIAGISGQGVPTGEFILGYPNHYDVIPLTPLVPSALDRHQVLPSFDNPYHAAGAWRDFGRHGSFVVYRKLEQHAATFWRTLRDESVRLKGTADPAYMIWLASKMVGRWPGGAPLIESPARDDPARAMNDEFEYGGDPEGLACPIASHIRRANPRDGLKPYPREQSRHMSEAHRLLRRARIYGPPLFDPAILRDGTPPADRDALLSLAEDGQARGIHFLCVNASIRSQFEFVQQTWCNNPSFGGLSESKDPVSGDHARAGEPQSRMVIPGPSGSIRTGPLPRFVTVRGGAYLFMPSIAALRFLAGACRA